MSDANPRDVRVDQLGLVDELVKQFRKPLADKIKEKMNAGDRLDGDQFTALLAGGGESISIDEGGFLKLFEAGKMTREQFLSAIKVGVTRAREILSEQDLLSVAWSETTAPSLRVTRLPGIQVVLIDAVKQIAAAITPGPRPPSADPLTAGQPGRRRKRAA